MLLNEARVYICLDAKRQPVMCLEVGTKTVPARKAAELVVDDDGMVVVVYIDAIDRTTYGHARIAEHRARAFAQCQLEICWPEPGEKLSIASDKVKYALLELLAR